MKLILDILRVVQGDFGCNVCMPLPNQHWVLLTARVKFSTTGLFKP